MADEHLERRQIIDLIVNTWSVICGLSPSELPPKKKEMGDLLNRAAAKLPEGYSPEQVDRILEVTAFLVQSGMVQMGSGNIWPDTPPRLFRDIFDTAMLSTLEGLSAPEDPENWVLVLEAFLPLGKRYLSQRGPNRSWDQVAKETRRIYACILQAWSWSRDDGEAAFPAALGATGAFMEAMIRRMQPTSCDVNRTESAIGTIHYVVDRCIDRALQVNNPPSSKDLIKRIKKVADGMTKEILALDHPWLDEHVIAKHFEDRWEASGK